MRKQQGMTTTETVLATLGIVILVVGVIVGGYLGGWWLNKDVQNRGANVARHSYEFQQTYREEATRSAATVAQIDVQLADPSVTADQKDALRAQRAAVVAQGCDQVNRISGERPADVDAFAQKECHQ